MTPFSSYPLLLTQPFAHFPFAIPHRVKKKLSWLGRVRRENKRD